MKYIHFCPRCGGRTFSTVAHVSQTWSVDEEGNFLNSISECDEVVAGPNNGNIWTCETCGTEAIMVPKDTKSFKVPDAWRNMDPDAILMKYQYVTVDGNTVDISATIAEVYYDWMTDADMCPENDATLAMLSFMDSNGNVLETPDFAYTWFEGIMEAFAICWPKLPASFVEPWDYPKFHEMYMKGERYDLAVNGFDPDNEPDYLYKSKSVGVVSHGC